MTARRGEHFTDGEIERIRKLAGERRTDEEIGLLLGRGRCSITNVRRRLGIEAGGGTYDHAATFDPQLVDRIRERAGQGWSDERIGGQIGKSVRQIWRLRQRFGISPGISREASSSTTLKTAAEARRDAHIAKLKERRQARRVAELAGAEA